MPQPKDTVASVLTARPAAAELLQRYGIDFCCNGASTMEKACAELSLDVQVVCSEIAALPLADGEGDDRDFSELETPALIDHILERYHEQGYALMGLIEGLIEKTVGHHQDKFDGVLLRIRDQWIVLANELRPHFRKEENILFPMMLQGGPMPLSGPMNVMLRDHVAAGVELEQLKTLTTDFTAPEEGCRSVKALFDALRRFDMDTRRHIYMENYVLFPRFVPDATVPVGHFTR